MAAEIREASDAVRRQEAALAAPLRALAARLRKNPPPFILTCARGSSGHAAHFAKHAIEKHLAIPVAAAAPSIVTLYRRDLHVKGGLYLAISQSGASDDLLEQTESARRAGALTVALVNAEDSPLAQRVDIVLPLLAGAELSVAATKSFIATLAALLRLVALWAEDDTLIRALPNLPDALDGALATDWSAALPLLQNARAMMVIGRGPTFAVAREAALKLKETCHLQAEAFSGAEFLHGPVTLVEKDYPMLLFMASDRAGEALRVLAADLAAKGAAVLRAGRGEALAIPDTGAAETDAIVTIQSFYRFAAELAARRGGDADHPRHLSKITRTL